MIQPPIKCSIGKTGLWVHYIRPQTYGVPTNAVLDLKDSNWIVINSWWDKETIAGNAASLNKKKTVSDEAQ